MAKKAPTTPEMAGKENISDSYLSTHQNDELGKSLMAFMNHAYAHGLRLKRKSAWSPEELEAELQEFFLFCDTSGLKPAKAGIRLWLNVSESQYYDWEKNTGNKYQHLSEIIRQANAFIEWQYVNRAEKYPTANIFLLKSSHSHIEQSKLDVTSNGKTLENAEDVKDMISRLGLDK